MASVRALPFVLLLLAAACSTVPPPSADPSLLSEIQAIRAIDNHAHPMRVAAAGEQPDRGFDALPVDNMEPSSDPLGFRPGAPAMAEATRALFGSKPKAQTIQEKGEQYPAWVLDQLGIETMLANR